jgi:hypothetical protein
VAWKAGFDRQSRGAPFRKSFQQSGGSSSTGLKKLDRLIRVDAVRTPAIRDVLSVPRKLFQTAAQIRDRDRDGAGDVTRLVLTRWARVEDDDILGSGALEQLRHRHRFGSCTITEVVANKTIELR